jgi:hypothetical protein
MKARVCEASRSFGYRDDDCKWLDESISDQLPGIRHHNAIFAAMARRRAVEVTLIIGDDPRVRELARSLVTVPSL